MSSNVYVGLPESDLLQMRTDVLAQLEAARKGKRFLSVGGAGKSFTKDNMTVAQLKDELEQISFALSQANPTTYGKRTKVLKFDFSVYQSQ